MQHIRNILWWITVLILGMIIQVICPRLDALVPGALIAMQEKDYRTMVWLIPLIIMLQEGTGTQHFGASILWFAGFFFFFHLWKSMTAASTGLFILALSVTMGALRALIAVLFAILQQYPFSTTEVLQDSILEAVYIPVAWYILSRLRHTANETSHEDD